MSRNIEKLTRENKNYRQVISTTKNLQLVLMRLKPEEEIGMESHVRTTQFIRIESGACLAIVDERRIILRDNDFLIIRPGERHNIINLSKTKSVHLYTIYGPPEHPVDCVQVNKSDECV